MERIKKRLILKPHEYYTTHLSILNALFPAKIKLTPKEIEVLAAFLSFEGDLANMRFSTTGRKLVKEKLGITDGGLGNYIKSLKEKGFVTSGVTGLQIKALLFAEDVQQDYQFRLIKEK